MTATTRRRHSGFLLIEVMVAVVVLAIGLLGVSALQIGVQKSNHSALQRSKATMLGYYMMDAMRANKAAALLGSYDFLTGTDSPVCSVPSTGNLVANDIRTWIQTLKSDLGDLSSTCGFIKCDVTNCTVRIYWDDSRAVGGATSQVIAITSRL